MRALIALVRQWEFSISALLAVIAGLSAVYLFQAGDASMSGLCGFTCIGFLWDCQGFGRIGTVHLRLAQHVVESEEG
jgi:hypothetical protein